MPHPFYSLVSVPSQLQQDPRGFFDMVRNEVSSWGAATLRVALVVLVAVVLRALVHRAIARVVRRAIASPTVPETIRQRLIDQAPAIAAERRRQRSETVGSVLRSIASVTIYGIAFTTVLGELGVDLGPIIASAGILGLAVGFGAQNLVKDFLTGIFMILEDQYGVGDAIDVGEASGIVEAVGLRTTRLRSVDGIVWHVRNGEIVRVGNMSQGWSRALLDISVAYETDLDAATACIKSVANAVWKNDKIGGSILEEPEVWGVEDLGIDGIAIRLVVKTAPLEQWKVSRQLRRRLKDAFDAAGIEIPFPQRSLWLRTDPKSPPSVVAPDPAEATSPQG
ncbi:MAG: mechanosensitive ion channel family protein [Mycobacteriales bacterium]